MKVDKFYHGLDDGNSHGLLSRIKINLVYYGLLLRPWQKALIIKVLGRNISRKLFM